MVAPPAVLAGEVAVGVTSLAVAGTASPPDLAEVVAGRCRDGHCSCADLADVGMASLADAGMAFPGDLAGVVTVGVVFLADAGIVTVGVTDLANARAASLADAGMAFPADPAGVVTIGVASLADAGMVTVGVTDLANAGAVSLAAPVDIADGPEYCGGVISCGDRVSPGVWCRERIQIQNNLDCQYVNYVSCASQHGLYCAGRRMNWLNWDLVV